MAQLPQCRAVDLRVRGYRPPQSRITSELTDYSLTRLNFEWFACGARSLGHADCALENGIVKIPIHLDDYPLFIAAKPYEQWEAELLGSARAMPFFGFGLHDCYAAQWLKCYPDLLDKLATMGQFVSADDVCDSMFLDELRKAYFRSKPIEDPLPGATPHLPGAKTHGVFARVADWLLS